MADTLLTHGITSGLVDAHRSGVAWAPPAFDAALTLDEAYRVQDAVAQHLGWFSSSGASAWKAGGKAQMTAAGLPVVLPTGSSWSAAGCHELALEAELAFRLGRTPTGREDVLACIATVCVSIEMVGTRMKDGFAAPMAWRLADNGLHGVLVTGHEVPFVQRPWAEQSASVKVNGAVRADVRGSHPNGDPLAPLPWLVEHLHSRGGQLRAGDLVTTGAWSVLRVNPGDSVEVSFDGVGKAMLQTRL
ncbi:2-keto-4-pentenoate hydratase [Hydrogenophaga sp.]|uniref:2-keto-4-pentenoate hydratase n=1 Tax=Hydrogenophaga sp. TaxID=1904254 RepID=UPI00271EEC45|nr:fumarylacetoacetate hydrolase family protein [Hydrogenophaga sp.]MDO9436682.1 fumarylacetoacetate hydrolase family protein [Hydrogenophaga sp.]